MSIRSPSPPRRSSPLAAAVDGALMLLRCAGPLLTAGAALVVVGGVLRHPWLVTIGAMIVLMAATHALRCHVLRRRGAVSADGCCADVPPPGAADDPSRPKRSRNATT